MQEASYNYYLSRLKSTFDFCNFRGWNRQNLLANITRMNPPRKRRMQPEARVLLALLGHAKNGRDRCYPAVAINTGLRASEITNIKVGDVGLARGSLRVWISKTKEEDDQPITLVLDRELRRWLTDYALEIERPLHSDDFLFPARLGSRYAWRYDEDGSKEKFRTKPSWTPAKKVAKTEKIVQEALAAEGLPTLHEGTHTIRRAVARHFFDGQTALGHDGRCGSLARCSTTDRPPPQSGTWACRASASGETKLYGGSRSLRLASTTATSSSFPVTAKPRRRRERPPHWLQPHPSGVSGEQIWHSINRP